MSDVNSIKSMREKKYALVRENRDLIDKNPGKAFDAVQKEFDMNMAHIDSLDRQINAAQDQLNSEISAKLDGFTQAAGLEWRNQETGAKIPVAFANKGSFRDQLQEAFPGRDVLPGGPKASMGEF